MNLQSFHNALIQKISSFIGRKMRHNRDKGMLETQTVKERIQKGGDH